MTVGAGAIIAAGTTVTEDVPDDSLGDLACASSESPGMGCASRRALLESHVKSLMQNETLGEDRANESSAQETEVEIYMCGIVGYVGR